MKVYLIDGTYELFRHYFAMPKHINARGEEVGATRGVLNSVLSLLNSGVTHIAVATDQVIESFRNILWADYKDSTGVAPDLLSQFPIVEEALSEMGVLVWAMVEYEADDALAAGAAMYRDQVEQVLICTPDKDLSQCVVNDRVVQFDRRQRKIINEQGVIEKFGVSPESIPDYLALVGDSADGYPGLAGWGAKAASAVLSKYKHLEQIPENPREWMLPVRSADRLAYILHKDRELAFLYRQLATLITKGPVKNKLKDLEWSGPTSKFQDICSRLEAPDLPGRVNQLASIRVSRK